MYPLFGKKRHRRAGAKPAPNGTRDCLECGKRWYSAGFIGGEATACPECKGKLTVLSAKPAAGSPPAQAA